MGRKITIKSTSVLLVEGLDECNFFDHLLKHLGKSRIQVIDGGGKDNFSNTFEFIMKKEGFKLIEKMGFVRDAEENPAEDAFKSITNILKKHNIAVPKNINDITIGTSPTTGIFIMPDNKSSGMLEDLCIKAINEESNKCIENYMQCCKLLHNPDEKEKFNESKARVQTYLASRVPIRKSLGLGAVKGFWDFDHSCFDDIKHFLNKLFN